MPLVLQAYERLVGTPTIIGAGPLETVTVRDVDVALFPAASLATATIACAPFVV